MRRFSYAIKHYGHSGFHRRPGLWVIYFHFGVIRWRRRPRRQWLDYPGRDIIPIKD